MKIKQLTALILVHGFSLADIVRRELGVTLTALSTSLGCKRSELSMMLNCHKHRIYPELREKVARTLGLTPGELDRLIDTYVDAVQKKQYKPKKGRRHAS